MARLRAVAADETPLRSTPKTITDSLDGDARGVLAAMRHELAKKLDKGDVSSNSIASAYKELRELDRLVRQHDDAEHGNEVNGGQYTETPFDATAL